MATLVLGKTTYETVEFSKIECGGCGIPFLVPAKWHKNKIDNNGEFHCPNGCTRVYTGETAAEKAKRELEEFKRKSAREQELLTNQLLDTVSEKEKYRKQLKRLHKGVCPCCNRSFVNLQQHMKKQHPDHILK